jgi:hypothetical protein
MNVNFQHYAKWRTTISLSFTVFKQKTLCKNIIIIQGVSKKELHNGIPNVTV